MRLLLFFVVYFIIGFVLSVIFLKHFDVRVEKINDDDACTGFLVMAFWPCVIAVYILAMVSGWFLKLYKFVFQHLPF